MWRFWEDSRKSSVLRGRSSWKHGPAWRDQKIQSFIFFRFFFFNKVNSKTKFTSLPLPSWFPLHTHNTQTEAPTQKWNCSKDNETWWRRSLGLSVLEVKRSRSGMCGLICVCLLLSQTGKRNFQAQKLRSWSPLARWRRPWRCYLDQILPCLIHPLPSPAHCHSEPSSWDLTGW